MSTESESKENKGQDRTRSERRVDGEGAESGEEGEAYAKGVEKE